ncbi:hypothetical protein LO772_35095 [Yinghuangia sp. ASG 101]|uniref:acyl-CoA dehydrogenase family protein n=1 Tax=Yinghuangia sp. ASG 101 TaxID=2896848 RepID=UPI001E4A5DBE|nr:acyl-CoA dehydrogenase family protein [Yinghuangia sp. ASG 101]UGQ11927.1 hypothetical protein LO772_35095 [Yinghuangia sp. ASG 101]
MTTATGRADREFLDAASRALRSAPEVDALAALGWWDLLTDLTDPENRGAALALFRAQGREGGDTPALGALLAQPFLAASGLAPGALVAAIPRQSARRGERLVAVGDVAGRHLLIDRPGHGAFVVPCADVALHPVAVPGRLTLHEVAWEPRAGQAAIAEERAAEARALGWRLGRAAAALDMLGAAETTVRLAVEHARNREQFGSPIGTFQAVRHLLARTETDCAAIESVTRTAVRLGHTAPPHYDEVVKALAGRNALRVCETTLQVLGAIGFTAESTHHHHHSRVLALDALLGTSVELTHALGTRARLTQDDPVLPSALLLSGPDS